MLFRPQKISVLADGAVMAADERSVELYATTAGFGSLGELLKHSNAGPNRRPRRAVRGERFGSRERDERLIWRSASTAANRRCWALSRVLERWIAHFCR
jgi:hypothetical protein